MRKWLVLATLTTFGALSLAVPALAADDRAWSPTGRVYNRGARAVFVARTFVPQSEVVFTLFSPAPSELGTVPVDARGVARASVVLPRRADRGEHTVRASGIGTNGPQHLDLAITIRPTGPPEWQVTGRQARRYAIAVAAVVAFVVITVVQRRSRKAAARSEHA